jgi:hypothetical protein
MRLGSLSDFARGRLRSARGSGGVFSKRSKSASRRCSLSSSFMRGKDIMSDDNPEDTSDRLYISLLDAYHCMVGRIASQWSSLEFDMDYLIWQLAEVAQEPGTCITSQLNGTGARMRTIIALLGLRSVEEPIVKKFRSFEGHAQELSLLRNRIVHDTWAYGEPNKVVQLRLAIVNKQLDFGLKEIEFEEISKTLEKIAKAEASFRNLIGEIFEKRSPLPGIGPYIPRGMSPHMAPRSPPTDTQVPQPPPESSQA